MRDWEDRCTKDGAVLVCDSVICNETPHFKTDAACVELGKKLAYITRICTETFKKT